MRDNGAPSIWKSCYKQLSLSYQSSGRGGGSPPGASALPPRRRSSARAAVVLVSFVVAPRARSSAPRRMCASRRCAGAGWWPPPLPSRRPRLFWWGGCARAARDCARCGARYTAGTWLSTATPCGVAALKPLHMEQHGKGIIFFGDMCGEENTSRPANVRAVRLRRTARALQSGRKPLCPKVILLGSLGTHRFANGACCCLLRSRASCRRRSC